MPFQLFLYNKFNYICISTNYIKSYIAQRGAPWQPSHCFYSYFFQPEYAAVQAVFLFKIISLHAVGLAGRLVVHSRYMTFHRIYLIFQQFTVSVTLHFMYSDACHSNMVSCTLTQKCSTAPKKKQNHTFIEPSSSIMCTNH